MRSQWAAKLVLRFIFITNLLPLFLMWYYNNMFAIIKLVTPPFSYVDTIQGNDAEVRLIKNTLQQFNDLTSVDIVPNNGYRPIKIVVIEDFIDNAFLAGTTVGRAHVLYQKCDIQLARKQLRTEYDFKMTLLHEYLHCFGYEHVDNSKDLMYKYTNTVSKKSIDEYAKDLAERIVWKNFKN